MDFELPEELRELQANLRRFVSSELIPVEAEVNQAEDLAPDQLAEFQKRASGLGLWHYDVPEEYGGLGMDLLGQCVVQEEIAKTKALKFRRNELFGPNVGPILYQGDEDQIERFLKPLLRGELSVCFAQSEPDAGSDPRGIRTRAVRDGDEYVVNGTKRWITGARESDYAQVICRTDAPDEGVERFACVLVDMTSPGVEIIRSEPTMTGDAPDEIGFSDVRVPVANRIGEEGDGFKLAQSWITMGRIKGHGARCVGIAQRALEMMIEYANQRVTFGRPLSDRQAIQFMIADSAMELRCARLLVYDAAARFDRGQDVRDESYMVKIVCTETAGRIVDRAIQVHGGTGLSTSLPLEYWYRQLRGLRITEGVTEVLRWRLGRNLSRAAG